MTKHLATATSILLAIVLLAGCNDKLSTVGGGIKPASDNLNPEETNIALSVKTILIDSLYERSTYALLGHFNDPTYGTYRASYISRLQHAPHFKPTYTPVNDKIKNTFIRIRYNGWVGDSTALAKLTAYQVTKPLPNNRYTHNLTPFLEGAIKLGQLAYQAGNNKGIHELVIPIDNSIGNELYKKSKEHPEWFDSQEAFENNVFRGLYIESTTGSGCMLSVYNTELVLGYEYEHVIHNKKTNTDSTILVANEDVFTNTEMQFLHRNFEVKNIAQLLNPNPNYAYITTPKGLALSLTLHTSDLNKLVLKQVEENNGKDRLINGATLQLPLDVPSTENTILQPPSYLLMVPRDSLNSFFEKGLTELTSQGTAFLSNIYNVTNRQFTFDNISLLLNKHITNHLKKDDTGRNMVDKDLEIVIIPVVRETTSQGSGNTSTVRIGNYLFPSAARIKLTNGTLNLKSVSTLFTH